MLARVLAGDHVGLAQRAQHAQRDVLEVADRSGADDQPPRRPAAMAHELVERQHPGAQHPRLGAEPGRHDAHLLAVGAQAAGAHLLARGVEQQVAGRHRAAADHDHLGVEDVHEVREADAELAADVPEHHARHLVAAERQLRDQLAR